MGCIVGSPTPAEQEECEERACLVGRDKVAYYSQELYEGSLCAQICRASTPEPQCAILSSDLGSNGTALPTDWE